MYIPTHENRESEERCLVPTLEVANLWFWPACLEGGTQLSGVLWLNGPAPQEGFRVRLTSSDPNLLEVVEAVTIPEAAWCVFVTVTATFVPKETAVCLTACTPDSQTNTELILLPLGAEGDLGATAVCRAG